MLFVDDETDILEGLENRFHPLRHFWHARFASSGEEALRLLAEEPADVIISDMRMPGMDGAELLAKVRQQWPSMIRIMLSGETGDEGLLRATAAAHQVLAKPCDIDRLKDKVSQAIRLRNCLNQPPVIEAVSQLGSLPALPEISQKLQSLISDGHGTIDKIASLIEQDAAMTARIMQLANAANIAEQPPVQHVHDALARLGLELVHSLIVTQALSLKVTTGSVMHQAIIDCQAAAVRTARLASELADPPELKQTVFAIAMLRSVGELALLQVGVQASVSIHPVLLSGYLLSLWGFPLEQVAAVTFSHLPMLGNPGPDDAATVVHVANALQRHLDRSLTDPLPPQPEELDPEWLSQCPGSTETLRYWTRIARAFNTEQAA